MSFHHLRSRNNESTKPLPRYQARYIKDAIVISVIDEETLSSYRWSMAVIVGMVSQKGGVGKSTLSRLVAREYANAGWSVKIADLDVSQGTSFSWGPLCSGPPGSSRRAGGFSLVLRPTTTGVSFWEFDCFTVQKRSSFGTQSSPRRTFLAGRRSGRLECRFPRARLLLPGGSPS